jgi:hypothetical protein
MTQGVQSFEMLAETRSVQQYRDQFTSVRSSRRSTGVRDALL